MNLFEMGKRPDGNWSYLPSSKINHFTFFSSAFARSTNRLVASFKKQSIYTFQSIEQAMIMQAAKNIPMKTKRPIIK
jgi:hypothetical protein